MKWRGKRSSSELGWVVAQNVKALALTIKEAQILTTAKEPRFYVRTVDGKGCLAKCESSRSRAQNGASQKMSDVKRTSLIALLARLVGFTLGGAVLGFAAMLIGTSFLGGVQGGISQRWTLVVLLGILVGWSCRGQKRHPPRQVLAQLRNCSVAKHA